MNQITVCGKLGQDPDVKYYDSGKVKATFSIAVDRFDQGENKTDWFRVEMWDRQAELAAEYLKKGKSVCISGSVSVDYYEKDGEPKEFWRIKASEMQFNSINKAVISGVINSASNSPNEHNKPIYEFDLTVENLGTIKAIGFNEALKDINEGDITTFIGKYIITENKKYGFVIKNWVR